MMSFIKKSLSDFDNGKYFSTYYDGTTKQKNITFAINLPKPHFTKEQVLLEDDCFTVIFSTDNKDNTGIILFQSFLEMKYKEYNISDNNSITLINIELFKNTKIKDNEIIMRTFIGSPVMIKEHDRSLNYDTYITCEDDDFENKLNEYLKRQLIENGFNEKVVNELNVEYIDERVIKLAYYHYPPCTDCILKFSGNSVLLQYIYDNGVMSCRSAGFGMLKLI